MQNPLSCYLIAVCLFGTTLAQADDRVDLAAEEAAIREARILQTQALAAQDLDEVARYWTPDATFRRALGQSVQSAAEAKALIEAAASAEVKMLYQRETLSVEVSPNWPLAYEEGRWSGHPGSASEPPIVGGRYAAQWVKRDGQWLIRSEVFVALSCEGPGCEYPAVP